MFELPNRAARRRRRPSLVATACLALAPVLACGSTDRESRAPGEERAQPAREQLPADLAALLDSGTVAHRAGDYEAARRHYGAAAERAPELASTWFGVYLAESALGNQEAADAAMARFRELGGAADMHHTPHGDSVPEGGGEVMQTRPS